MVLANIASLEVERLIEKRGNGTDNIKLGPMINDNEWTNQGLRHFPPRL